MREAAELGDRRWWPAEYADEVMPDGRPSPADWLLKLPVGGFAIASPYHKNEFETEREAKWRYEALFDGQRVDFIYYAFLGKIEITIEPGGNFQTHGLVHPDASWFWDYAQRGDGCPSGDTLEEFARVYAEEEGIHEPKRVTVGCGQWSGSIPYSVSIVGDTATLQEAGSA